MVILFISVCAAIVVYSVIEIFELRNDKKILDDRIRAIGTHVDIDTVRDTVLKENKRKKSVFAGMKLVSRKFDDSLVISGIKLSGNEFVIMWAVLTIVPMTLLLMLGKSVVSAIAIAIIGFAIPPMIVSRSKQKRLVLFNKQLGESLVIMSNCMKSGYSFQQAIESTVEEMQAPISVEFGRVVRELNYGVPLQEALGNMKDRVNNEDFNIMVSAVLTSTQIGANLSDMLQTISHTIQDRISMRDEVRVLTAQGRISGIIVGLLPIALMLILMLINPNYIQSFLDEELGRIMLMIGACMELLGFLIIRRIIDIKY